MAASCCICLMIAALGSEKSAELLIGSITMGYQYGLVDIKCDGVFRASIPETKPRRFNDKSIVEFC